MFAIRPRSRPRRPSRFVPGVDGLQARIAPVLAAPIDPGVVEVGQPPVQPSGRTYEEIMTGVIEHLGRECSTSPAEV